MPILQIAAPPDPDPVRALPSAVTLTIDVTPKGRKVQVSYDLDETGDFTFCPANEGELHPTEGASDPEPKPVSRSDKTVSDQYELSGPTTITRVLCLANARVKTGFTSVLITATDRDVGPSAPDHEEVQINFAITSHS